MQRTIYETKLFNTGVRFGQMIGNGSYEDHKTRVRYGKTDFRTMVVNNDSTASTFSNFQYRKNLVTIAGIKATTCFVYFISNLFENIFQYWYEKSTNLVTENIRRVDAVYPFGMGSMKKYSPAECIKGGKLILFLILFYYNSNFFYIYII